jgi:hypothetical protein
LGKPQNSSKIDERLGRVETLLEKLVEKDKSQESDDSHSPEDGRELRELLPQLSSNASNFNESGPILSLFDNSVVSNGFLPVDIKDSRCATLHLIDGSYELSFSQGTDLGIS